MLSSRPEWLADRRAAQRFLVQLRWAGMALVAVASGIAMFLDRSLSPWPLLIPMGLQAASNIALHQATKNQPAPGWLATGALVFDVALLTLVLSLSGGAMNPFSASYLTLIVVASLILQRAGVATVVAACAVLYGSLFLMPATGHAAHMRGHLIGMWLGTGLVGTFVSVAILRFRRALANAEAELRESQASQARSAQLAALGTLAAGAAHELASPLTTVAVISKELSLRLENSEDQADAQVLREEVDRCREILSQMAVQVGSSPATSAAPIAIEELIEHALQGIAPRPLVQLELQPGTVRVPKDLMAQVIRSLVRNAQQSSGPEQSVSLQVQAGPSQVEIRIQDHGHGMSPQVLERATQPFFTTKEPGEGMGLGLFVADSVLRQLGGTLTLESVPEQGTTATLSLTAETP